MEILKKSLRDIFDEKILFLSLIPIFISIVFWGILFYIFYDDINQYIKKLIEYIPFIQDGSFIATIIETIGGGFIYYQLVIITSMTIVGIVADKVVDRINEKYYLLEKHGFGTVTESIWISIKQNFIFMFLFILFIPLMFVPIINIIINVFLWTILLKKPLFYDSISGFANKNEFELLWQRDKLQLNIITILNASLFLIPFLGVFVYIIQLIIFTHFNLERLYEIRNKNA